MTQNHSYHPQPKAVHNIYRPKLKGSQVVYIIHNYQLFINSRSLSLEPRVFHVNHYLELFIISKAPRSYPGVGHVIHNPELLRASNALSS